MDMYVIIDWHILSDNDPLIYKEEAKLLLHDYYIELLLNSIYANIICRMTDIENGFDEELNIDIKEFNAYLTTLEKNYNLYDMFAKDKVSLKDPFIYGFGQLFSIYMYENYKKDPEYFKREFNKKKPDIDIKDSNGNTMVNLAVQSQCKNIVMFLLNNGANPNIANDSSNTPLHYALSHHNFEIVDILLKKGANENIPNKNGITSWQCLNFKHSIL